MKIYFERTGGFAGIKIRTAIDSSDLPNSQAKQLRELLARARFFELPAKLEASFPGADRFQYRLTVETEKDARTVEASDAAVPGELRPLLDWLIRFARK